jgi:hypothetical protein
MYELIFGFGIFQFLFYFCQRDVANCKRVWSAKLITAFDSFTLANRSAAFKIIHVAQSTIQGIRYDIKPKRIP